MSAISELHDMMDLPGFVCVIKKRVRCAVHYNIGIDPFNIDGDPSGQTLWAHGDSIAAAVQEWWTQHGHTHPFANAQKFWLKQAANRRINER